MSDHEPDRAELKYPQIVRAVSESPWAIEEATLEAILEMLSLRASGQRFSHEEVQARIGSGPPRRDVQVVGGVAVIPVFGVITPRADLFTEMSGGTSVQSLQSALRDAIDDEQVSSIVFDVDSPGGHAAMIPELAAEIRAARGKKPMVAVANTRAASAAYWLASQADELVVTPSGDVGSIGVLAAHTDISGMEEKLGQKTTLVTAGKHKAEFSQFAPLSDDARKALQERVDETYTAFVADVAKGRRVSVDTVRKDFGEGRMLTAKKALSAGMVDRIDTLEATVQRLMPPNRHRQSGGATASTTAPVTLYVDGRTFVSGTSPPGSLTITTNLEAAESGLSFAQESAAVHDAAVLATGRADALADRTRSLAEFDRGRLTAAKRDQLTADRDGLIAAAQALDELLVATDPDKHRNAVLAEVARFEARRSIAIGGAR